MEDNFCPRIVGITALFALVHLFAIQQAYAGTVSFCDGITHIEKTRDQCGAGVTFGENKPECICVSGIYRFVADTCETADGFAENVCTKLSDDNGLGATIVGVKFTRDPTNWQQTGIVCERKGFGTETWDFITDKHSRGSTTKSSNIYSVNGKAFMTAGHHNKAAFCVEPATLPESEKICRYLKSENEDIWKAAEVEVIVKAKCEGNAKPLTPHKCFGLLTSQDSECSLDCSPRDGSGNTLLKSIDRSFRGVGRVLSSASKKYKEEQKNAIDSKNSVAMTGRAVGAVKPTTYSQPPVSADDPSHPTEYWKHDNKFLNRKMMIYNIISQLDTDNSSNVTYGEPKRTFELFDMMKEITMKYCPGEFVAPEWIELVINLFYIIHKGNIFKYDENLSEGEYGWIKDILTTCHGRISGEGSIDISTDPTLTDPEEPSCHPNGGGLGTGFCNGTKSENGECNFVPVIVPGDRANDSYHYVPEVAWDIVDIIQVVCFPEFNVSYRMFHVLEQAAEKLFTLQVKNLWYYPNWSEKTKKRLLGTSADVQMHNLEVCIYAAYKLNGKIPRLVRPKPVKYLRKKRSVATIVSKPLVSEGVEVDVYCSKSRKEFNNFNCPHA